MRTPMITRTIKGEKVTVLSVAIADKSVSEKEIVASRLPRDDEKALAFLNKNYAAEGEKFVAINGRVECNTLYGMTEADFIRLAKPLNDDNDELPAADDGAEQGVQEG